MAMFRGSSRRRIPVRAIVTVVASYLVHTIACGIGSSAGLLQVFLQEYFALTGFQVSWITSVLISGTIVGGLARELPCCHVTERVLVVIGGLLAGLGWALAFIVKYQIHAVLTIGVLGGFGLGLSTRSSLVISRDVLSDNDHTVQAILSTAPSAGTVIVPWLVHNLLVMYPLPGALLMTGGIALNVCVCGMMMSPAHAQSPKRYIHSSTSTMNFRNDITPSRPLKRLLHCLSHFFWSFGVAILTTLYPVSLWQQGTTVSECVALVSVVGAASLVGRTILALYLKDTSFDDVTVHVCTQGMAAVITLLSPVIIGLGRTGRGSFSVLVGFYSGVWTPYVTHTVPGQHNKTSQGNADKRMTLVMVIAYLLGPPIAGSLMDAADLQGCGSALYLAGTAFALSSISLACVNFIKKRDNIRTPDSDMTLGALGAERPLSMEWLGEDE